MYDRTITLFNYRKEEHSWYTTVFDGADVIETLGKTATRHGDANSENVEIILHCTPAQVAMDINGNEIQFVSPRAYAALDDVHGFFTLTPESDFIMIGNYGEADAVDDDDYDEGLYHALNDEHDGVYMITGATWYSLLPHFEIGGK